VLVALPGSGTTQVNLVTAVERVYTITSTIITDAADISLLSQASRELAEADIRATLDTFEVEMGPTHTDHNGVIRVQATTLNVNAGDYDTMNFSFRHDIRMPSVHPDDVQTSPRAQTTKVRMDVVLCPDLSSCSEEPQRSLQNSLLSLPSISPVCRKVLRKLYTMAAPGGVAPVVQGGGARAAPQLPCGADPGTFTGWLLHDTATLSESDVVQSVVGALGKYASLPLADAVGYMEALQGLIEEALSSDDLNCFTEVSSSAQGTEIGIVSSLARYSAGFGVASTHNGCEFGLRGEMVDAVQLPPLIQVPSATDGGISSLFALRECVVPTVAQVTAHYSSPIVGRLMASPANVPLARFPPLLFVPKVWAPYFLQGHT
jgi:hypothetical protein